MNRRTLLASAAALAAAGTAPARAQAGKTRIVFWHAMNGALNDEVNRICAEFNAAQSSTEIVPVFKGTYAETLTAAIAAWRAGQAPHLVQMFEVGTGTMLAAGAAVKQTWQLIQETGVDIDPDAYIGAVRGYYSLPDGRHGLHAVQLLHRGDVDQPGRLREGRAGPAANRRAPRTSDGHRRQDHEGEDADAGADDHRLVLLDPARAVRGHARPRPRHRGSTGSTGWARSCSCNAAPFVKQLAPLH